MRCRDIIDSLSAYIDGMLDSSAASRVEEHIESCNRCRVEYEELLAAVELVRGLPEMAPPPWFREGLQERMLAVTASEASIASKPAARRFFMGRWMGVVAAAAVVFLTVGVTALWYGNQGAIPFPGFETRAADEQLALQHKAAGQTNPANDSARILQTDEKAMESTDMALNTRQSSVAEQEAPAEAVNPGEPAGSPLGRKGTFAGGGQGETGGLIDAGIMSEPPPPPDGEESMMFIAAESDLEQAARNAAPPGMGAGPLQAVEHTVTLRVEKVDDAVRQIADKATQYGGFMEPQQGETTPSNPVYKVPFYNAEPFLDEIERLSEVVERKTVSTDLAREKNELESRIAEIRELEQKLTRQLTHKGDQELEKELAALGEKMAGLQAELDALNIKAAMATIKLTFKRN